MNNNGLYLESARFLNLRTTTKMNYGIICVGYILDLISVICLRSHQLINEKKVNDIYKFTVPLMYIFGIVIGKIHLAGKAFLTSLLIFSVLLYYSLISNSLIFYIILEHLQYGIYNLIRYNYFFIVILANTHTIEIFRKQFPYVCIVSNFGNVIEIQGVKLLSKLNVETDVLLAFSAGFLMLGLISKMFVINQIDIKRYELYHETIKYGRGIFQSIFNGCCVVQYNIILKLTELKIKPTKLTDILLIVSACVYFYINKHMFSSTKYMAYTLYVSPIAISLLSLLLFFDSNILNCMVYFGMYCVRFMIHDLSRYKLYVQHTLKVIFEYIILDTCIYMLSEYITIIHEYTDNEYLIVLLGISLVYYSTAFILTKYMKKDEEMIRCIYNIETNI